MHTTQNTSPAVAMGKSENKENLEKNLVADLKKRIVSAANLAGAKKWDIFGTFSEDVSVQVQAQKPHQAKASQTSTITVRVWNENNKTGVASINSLEPKALTSAFAIALETAQFSNPLELCDFSERCFYELDSSTVTRIAKELSAHQKLQLNEMFSLLAKAEKQILDAHPAIVSLPYNGIAQRSSTRFYINSAGANRSQVSNLATCYLYTKAEQEGRKPRSAGVSRAATSIEGLNLEELTSHVIKKTISFLDYKSPSNKGYLTVFSGEAFLSLLEAFSNIFNARNILDKRSLSTEKSLGKQIASSWLTISDDPLHPANASAKVFDGEGTPTGKTTLLANGKLVSFLHSAGTAKSMGQKPTGNANLGSKVTVSAHFWNVSQGSADTQQNEPLALEAQESVILIDEVHSLHAGVNELQGSFSLPFSGWIFEKGKKTSIDSATIAGDFLKLLTDICFVEATPEITPEGVCPRVWVKNLSVTGETEV